MSDRPVAATSTQPTAMESGATGEVPRRIFISYKREVEPDEQIALQIFQTLNQHHQVFIDQTMTVGTRWAEQIETD
ncbi:hypothetical protein [Stenomitos frigidus]|uniref:TIR domain-containing protein n=1 Tax=Stenomitos frigidus ULC18 TaxID=2107698 RepID=A0A2T1E9K9_9CYAN|nr:hypothetical protein [Stenomitos frigidus]PSB29437.1 hypothetical protein C7B82_11490 [Stenomitos frigidus ULC18]